MTRLLTAAEMRATEQEAFASGEVSSGDLMERAGQAAARAIEGAWPDLAARTARLLVLCGPGNNGGDGFVVARALAERGWQVEVALLGDADRLAGDAAVNHARWLQIGAVVPLDAAYLDGIGRGAFDLICDALFGIGLSRPVDAGLVEAINRLRDRLACPLVALDMPSGLCADSGRPLVPGGAVQADLTLTFHAPKRGAYLDQGPEVSGDLLCLDIGLRPSGAAAARGVPLVASPKGLVGKPAGAHHKFSHGHALILSGGFGRTGAARLAARAALRVGAGLVTLAAPGSAMMECAAQLTAIMLRRCDDGTGLTALLDDARIGTLCLGPGMGTGDRAGDVLEAALAGDRPAVLDADALTLLAARPDPFAGLRPNIVLTPHGGEFARLFPDLAEALRSPAGTGPAPSRLDAARAAAERAGCIVLLKGPDTIIASPTGEVAVHAAAYDRAAPWLATAGAGDVLAGLITGLMARAVPPFEAACAAAWLHVEAARGFGPGLIAEDLSEEIPAVLKSLAV